MCTGVSTTAHPLHLKEILPLPQSCIIGTHAMAMLDITRHIPNGVSGLVVDIRLWLKGSHTISQPPMLEPGVEMLTGPDSP